MRGCGGGGMGKEQEEESGRGWGCAVAAAVVRLLVRAGCRALWLRLHSSSRLVTINGVWCRGRGVRFEGHNRISGQTVAILQSGPAVKLCTHVTVK